MKTNTGIGYELSTTKMYRPATEHYPMPNRYENVTKGPNWQWAHVFAWSPVYELWTDIEHLIAIRPDQLPEDALTHNSQRLLTVRFTYGLFTPLWRDK